ncbi:MAG: hypothetical protein GXO80_02115 [Chlorobi bacterium]|nr:hypothetical protein [Chlorobiota bacterium]
METIFQINDKNIETEFKKLADLILLQKELIVNDAHFNFTEIEFYYYSDIHQDTFTHKHDESAGKWRFHNQGFDITLRGDSGFGGILIRGVEFIDVFGNKFINGPRRVLFSIMEHLNSVDIPNNRFGIIDKDKVDLFIFKTFRHGLNKPNPHLKSDKTEDFKNAKYRFIVNPQSFNKKQFDDSEKIANGFNNKDLSYEFLGYELKHDIR